MPSKTKTILIVSSAFDRPVYGPVVDCLQNDGYRTIVYQADEVASGNQKLQISVPTSGKIKIIYDGKTIDPAYVSAAWYRRPTLFALLEPNAVRQHTLFREINALQQFLWTEIPDSVWLNAPTQIAYAERKIMQLKIAKRVGFTVPHTIVANTWEPILSKLPEHIIVKSSYGSLDAGVDLKVLYTKAFLNNPEELPTRHNPYPGIWQQQIIDKAREWRVTVVDDDIFCAAIYTDKHAKDDWRKHQNTSAVRFERGELPVAIQRKCRQYLRTCGLRFGAFDFIEDSSGRITFLECNTNGQYGWLEDKLGFGISRSIANSLERIADRNAQ